MADEEPRQESEGRYVGRENCRKHHGRHHRHAHAGSAMGGIWCIGWLFTLGYLHIPFFWKGVLALIIWPYYLGLALSKLPT